MRSPALITTSSKAGYHAVLASLSRRYPPLEGRSPTCYSPVCHSTRGRSHFRVRLACVRHAASVDSEPGSNSHVLVHRQAPLVGRRPLARTPTSSLHPVNSPQREKVFGSLAALFRLCQVLRLRPDPHRPGHPQADTRRVVSDFASQLSPLGYVETCVCLHALSSFQRTDRFTAAFAAGPLSTVRKGTF